MDIKASDVKTLRDMTGAGMLDCKKALEACNGNIDDAIAWLREKGISKAAKKADRIAAEGLADILIEGNKAVIVEVNSETDFVAKNQEFKDLVKAILKAIIENEPKTNEDVLNLVVDGETVNDLIVNKTAKIGEKLSFRRFSKIEKNDEQVFGSYIHMGGKIGVLVEFSFEKAETAQAESFKTFAHDVALQVAAVAPICATRDQVPAETVEHEKQIYMAQAAESGKPEAIQEKMAVGRLEKFYKQSVLTEQEFIKDSSLTIKKYAEQVSKELGDTITVVAFDRLVRGE